MYLLTEQHGISQPANSALCILSDSMKEAEATLHVWLGDASLLLSCYLPRMEGGWAMLGGA